MPLLIFYKHVRIYPPYTNQIRWRNATYNCPQTPIIHRSNKYFNCVSDKRQRNGHKFRWFHFISLTQYNTHTHTHTHSNTDDTDESFLTILLIVLQWIRTVFNLFITEQSIFDASHTSAISNGAFEHITIHNNWWHNVTKPSLYQFIIRFHPIHMHGEPACSGQRVRGNINGHSKKSLHAQHFVTRRCHCHTVLLKTKSLFDNSR